MAERLVNVDRQTPMFLPPDLREWVADNELVHLVLEAVELCDLHGARLNVRGSGSEQYPPSMMLALLIYAYATGLFSSRRIERATYESVAVRYFVREPSSRSRHDCEFPAAERGPVSELFWASVVAGERSWGFAFGSAEY